MSGLVTSEKRLAFVPNRRNLVVVAVAKAKAKKMILRMMDFLLEIIPPWS
jgi:hypothetical protein